MERIHHSDVIGSLLRPRYLTQARDEYAAGQLGAPEFKRIEDRAVDQAIAMQEGVGLDVVTDGEFRRFSFLDQVVGEINGVEPIEGAPIHFKSATADWVWHNPFTVTGNYISQSVTSTTISATGEALYNFVITNAGNYVIQALVNAPNDSANSFYVNIDAQPVDPTMAWDIFPFTSGFQNDIVSWRGTGSDTNNQFNPKIFALTAGAHQIIFALHCHRSA